MTPDVIFSDKFLTSDVLATNLMLTGFLFFPLFLSFQDENKLDSWFLSFFHQSFTLINGVTRGVTLGRKLSWRGTISQNSETKLRTIVNLWMPWISELHKKMKTPRKTQKKQPKEYYISKCQLEEAQHLHSACQEGRSPFAPCQLSHCPLGVFGFRFKLKKLSSLHWN